MGILRTILVIALFYYGFKLLTRYVFPFLLKRWVNKKMGQFHSDNYQNKGQQQAQDFAKQHEGEVKIKTRGKKSTSETKNMGDFVDYEEVE